MVGRKRAAAERAASSIPTWRITPRDVEILRWISRHGFVTTSQVTTRFFSPTTGAVPDGTAYRRIRKLIELGLIQKHPTFFGRPFALAVTRAGARIAANGLQPATLILAELKHSLAIVDLMEDLGRQFPEATVETERQLRMARHHELREGTRRVGEGRIPDGQLRFPDGRVIAIELDITPKGSRELAQIIRAYLSEFDKHVWYYCSTPSNVARLADLVKREVADDKIEVRLWQPS